MSGEKENTKHEGRRDEGQREISRRNVVRTLAGTAGSATGIALTSDSVEAASGTISFSPPIPKAGESVSVTVNATPHASNYRICELWFYFGDGTTEQVSITTSFGQPISASVSHVYQEPGTYSVTVQFFEQATPGLGIVTPCSPTNSISSTLVVEPASPGNGGGGGGGDGGSSESACQNVKIRLDRLCQQGQENTRQFEALKQVYEKRCGESYSCPGS